MATKYDYNTDYMALMQEAAAKGDFNAAALYEQQRNQKIADADAAGTNKWNAVATNDYAKYLGTGSGGPGNAGITQDENVVTPNVTPDMTYPTFDMNSYLEQHEKPTFNMDSYLEQHAKPTYESSYSAQIDSLLDKILNREDFSYDPNSDPLYQQYMSTYSREGDRAMRDTLASAASGAGGMNSYALAAAQQANNYYMAQMGDRMPELYQMAYEMYMADRDADIENLGILQGLDESDYGRYRDDMGDWKDQLIFDYGNHRDNVGDWNEQLDFDYNNYRDLVGDYWEDKTFDNNEEWKNKEWEQMLKEWDFETEMEKQEYNDNASKDAYDLAMDLIMTGGIPSAEQLKAAGLDMDDVNGIRTAQGLSAVGGTVGNTTTGGGNGGGGGGYDYTNGGMSKSEIIEIQKMLGVTADGLWGPKTQAAWEAYQKGDKPADKPADLGGNDSYDGNGGLTEAQIKEMQKYYGTSADGKWGPNSTKAAGGLNAKAAWDKYQKEKGGSDGELNNAILNLGIGPVSDDLVWNIMEFGGIKEVNGKLTWANGWSKSNWQSKLASATKTGNLGLFKGTLSY